MVIKGQAHESIDKEVVYFKCVTSYNANNLIVFHYLNSVNTSNTLILQSWRHRKQSLACVQGGKMTGENTLILEGKENKEKKVSILFLFRGHKTKGQVPLCRHCLDCEFPRSPIRVGQV